MRRCWLALALGTAGALGLCVAAPRHVPPEPEVVARPLPPLATGGQQWHRAARDATLWGRAGQGTAFGAMPRAGHLQACMHACVRPAPSPMHCIPRHLPAGRRPLPARGDGTAPLLLLTMPLKPP